MGSVQSVDRNNSPRPQTEDRWRGVRIGVVFVCVVAAFVLSVSASQGWIQFSWRGSPILGQPRLEGGVYDLQSIQVLNRALLHLHENYVDPARFSPRLMLAAGLDEVQKQVAEVTVTFNKPLSELPEQAVVQVGEKKQTFHFKDVDSLWEVGLKYQEIFFFIQENLPAEIERRDIEYTAINGMLKTLDPHSVLLSPKNYQSMVEGNRGNFGGLGITIRMIEGKLLVVNPMEETPASRAGILRGDQIVKIDDVWTQNMDLNDAVSLLRGEPGTQVHLLIARNAWEEPRDFTLTRDTIKIPAVSFAALDPAARIGYVHLKGFQGNTYTDMHAALTTLSDTMGGLKGLVLDLRDNPGGLLEQAIQVSDEFLTTGTIVTTVGSAGKYRKPYPAYENGTQPTYPIVVLINPGSASASEIVAGALKNHDRALLLGDTSFGKGSVQVLYELQDGSALKLTIAQYLTPGDVSIQSVGVTPDIQLQPMRVQPALVDLYGQSWIRREATLASHLSHESARSDATPTLTLPYLAAEVAADVAPDPKGPQNAIEDDQLPALDDDAELPPERDPQVRLARELLLAAGDTWQRPALLKSLTDDIARLTREEDTRLTQQLGAQNIDWSDGPAPTQKTSLRVTWSANQDPLSLDPNQEVTLTVTVANDGPEPLYRLHGVTDSSHASFNDLELAFGKLDPGASLSRSFTAKLDRQQRQRHDHIDIKLNANGNPPSAAPLATDRFFVQSIPQTPPHFALSYALIDAQGNGDGHINPGEQATIHLYAENQGQGVAPQPVAFLRSLNGSQVQLRDARTNAPPLEPGQRASYAFSFQASSELKGEPLSFELHVYDKLHGRAAVEKFSVPVRLDHSAALQPTASHAQIQAASATVHSLPLPDAAVIATAPNGYFFEVKGQSGAFLQVAAGDLQGWILSEHAKLLSEAPAQAAAPAVLPLVHTDSPPTLSFKPVSAVTEKEHLKLSVGAKDDGKIKDIQAFVYNDVDHRSETRKVAYRRIDAPSADLSFDVPLRLGLNRVRVLVRDDDGMETQESLFIYRR